LKKILFVLLIALIFLVGCNEELIQCGDGKCHSLNETAGTCPQDCDPNYGLEIELCGNGVIDEGENCSNCEEDVSCDTGFECSEGQCIEIQEEIEAECLTDTDCETGFECVSSECIEIQSNGAEYDFISEKVSTYKCNDPVVLKALKVVLGNEITLNKRNNPMGHPANESFCTIKSGDTTILYELVFAKQEYEELAFDSLLDEKDQILSQWFNSIEHNYSIGRDSYLFEQIQVNGSFFRILFVDDEQSVFVNVRAVKQTNINEAKGVAEALVKVI